MLIDRTNDEFRIIAIGAGAAARAGRLRLYRADANPGADDPAAVAGPRRASGPRKTGTGKTAAIRAPGTCSGFVDPAQAAPASVRIWPRARARAGAGTARANWRSRSPNRRCATERICASRPCASMAARRTRCRTSNSQRGVDHSGRHTPGRLHRSLWNAAASILSQTRHAGAGRSRPDARHGLHRRRRTHIAR